MIASSIYLLCAATSLACAVLLVRAWLADRSRLLMWSSVCFTGLFVNNVILVVDEIVTGDTVNLMLLRDVTNLASIAALVAGLVWSSR